MRREDPGSYEFFDHDADLGIEVHSRTISGLFSTASRALLSWMGPVPPVDEVLETRVEVEGDGLEELLVRWLQEILYLFYQRCAYAVEILDWGIENESRLVATIRYKPWDESRYQDYREVKAVTYHQLKVRQSTDGWSARIILDI